MTVGIFEAKQKLSELVERASQGEEIVITAGGRYAQKRTRPSWRRVVKVEGQINLHFSPVWSYGGRAGFQPRRKAAL